ncbi:unnamed protein product [Notodromas monacha]|uniref:Uncharacterized protein n=1 Tax=Notodromas monacha TaxID=399045 RepID=A0A7R9GCZ3_9CRUS|nr:unnamed protein product [Notodromas monacha]CAG0917992.1 unnamed protein product [Notodromas monacha]
MRTTMSQIASLIAVCCGCWAGRANRHSDPVVVIAPQEGLNGHSAVVLHTSNSFPLAAAMSRVQDEQLQENGNGLDLQSGTRDHQQQQAAPLAFLSWLVNTARNRQGCDEGLDAAAAAAAAAQPGIKQEGETPMDADAETDKEQEQGNEGSLSITSSLVIQSSSSESPASISADNQQQPEAQQEPIKSDEPDNQESIQTPEEPQAADPDSLPVFDEPEPEPEPASLVLPAESETPKSEPTALESKQPPVEQEAVVDEVIAAEKDNKDGPEAEPEAEPEPQVEQQQQKTSASESPMENETTSQVFVAGTETSSALSSTEEQHIAALQQNEGQTVIVTSTADQAKDSDSPVVILATSAEQSPPQINDEPEVEIIQADPDRVSADNTEAPIVPTMEPVDDQKTESPAQEQMSTISTMTTATSNSKTPVVMTDASEKDFIPKRPQFDSTFLRSPSFWVVLDKKRPGKVLH